MSDPIEPSNTQIIRLLDGLKALDGLPVKPGEMKYYDWPDDMAWDIAIGQVMLEPLVEAYRRAKNAVMKSNELADQIPADQIADKMESIQKALASIAALDDHTTPLSLGRLKKSILLKKHVPPSVIAKLMPVIEEG